MPRKREANAPKSTSSVHPSTAPGEGATLSDLELALAKSNHAIDLSHSAENSRRLQCRLLLLQHQLDQVNDQLATEHSRREQAQGDADVLRSSTEQATTELEKALRDLSARAREVDYLKTELSSLQDVSADSAKLLTEKLALAREIANLKPELEHLRAQLASKDSLLSEKLELQQQLSDTQAELKTERRALKRLQLAEDKHDSHDSHASAEIEQLKKDLARVREELEKAEGSVDKAQSTSSQMEKLKAELAKEKKEREKAQKAADRAMAQAEASWEAEKSLLDDKLSQFRTKLRSTKEKLKETEAELEEARHNAGPLPTRPAAEPRPRNPRKRAAAPIDTDTAIGTPGDANKRIKRASSIAVGEKSTFSITPFLNRTSGVTLEDQADVPVASIEGASSPTERPRSILGPASASNSNPKVSRKRHTVQPALEKVAEENDGDAPDENRAPPDDANAEATLEEHTSKGPQNLGQPKPKPTLKPRKSLAAFASFRESIANPRARAPSLQPDVKKKRKLPGASTKTLFDEDEDEAGDADGVGGAIGGLAGAGRQRTFGALTSIRSGFAGSLLSRKRGPMQVTNGFAFSPLKKERRAMKEAASRAGSEMPA